MGNIINNKDASLKANRTEKGNVLYVFQRISASDLDNYRIGSYAYIQ